MMLALTTSNYRRDLKRRECITDSVVDTGEIPEITIPLIHIANEIIHGRIEFVKEAFSLGFSFSHDHSIRLDNALKSPKTYFKLENIDFQIFESIINKCSERVLNFFEDIDAKDPIYFVYKCQFLIEENMFLFSKDFSKELAPLRLCSKHYYSSN